jgi:CubicO group peptidase (beta-lactamase class C family)
MEALGQVADWPEAHAAVAVLRIGPGSGPPGRPDVEVVGVTGDAGHPFPWASVTKPATALAVLVAVEEGTLSLDAPAGPPGSTVRHLLAHTSGLGPEGDRPLAAPGRRRIYSNAGYRVLGDLLSRHAGLSFGEYLTQGVLEPLGMTGTWLRDPDGEGAGEGDGEGDGEPDDSAGISEAAGEAARSPAAAGLIGPLEDLVALASEWAVPTLVSAETHRSSTTGQYPDVAGVLPGFGRFDPCPWGLGVEIRGDKQPHWTGSANSPETYGHFGRSGSFLWVDPVAGVACIGLGDRPFGPWAAARWPVLADAVLFEVAGRGPTR